MVKLKIEKGAKTGHVDERNIERKKKEQTQDESSIASLCFRMYGSAITGLVAVLI